MRKSIKSAKPENPDAIGTIDAVLEGVFPKTKHPKKFIQQQQSRLKAAGFDSKVGYILHVGRVADGTFQVQFNAEGDGRSDRWPQWAYEPARDSLPHGKEVWVIYQGDQPFGAN